MEPPNIKINLKLSNTVHYAVGPSGVYTSGTPYDIIHLPMGWKDIELKTGRDSEGWGLVTDTTTTFKFTLDARDIIRYVNYREGAAGRCTIDIYLKSHTQWDDYKLIYTGDIDFNTFLDQKTSVSVDILQGGVASNIVRDQDKTFEFPLSTNDSLKLLFDGVALRNKSILGIISTPTSVNFIPGNSANRPPVRIAHNESTIAVSVVEDTQYEFGSVSDLEAVYIFKPVIAGNLELVWDANLITNASASGSVRWGLWASVQRSGATVSRTLLFEVYNDGNNNLIYDGAGVRNIAVQAGDGVSIYGASVEVIGGVLTPTTTYAVGIYWKKGIYTLTYNTRQAATIAYGYRYGEFLRRFIAVMTDNVATLSPNILDDANATLQDLRPYHLCVTPAESVRGLTNTVYKVKFSDIVKDLSRLGLAFSIQGNTIYLNRKDQYIQDTQIANLGVVDTVEISPALPYLFSGVKVGSAAGNNDALQGRYEINAPQEFKITPSKSDGDIDYGSPFFAGMYAIEEIRSQRISPTTNQRDDNRIILYEVEATPAFGYYQPYRPQLLSGNTVSGLIDQQAGTTAFNLTLSPARDLIRNKPQISVNFAPYFLPKVMAFLSAEREGNMYSRFSSGLLVSERYGVGLINFLSASPPFLPFIARFVAAEPVNFYTLIQANPYGYLSFSYRGRTYKGFIHEIVRHPGNNAQMECQLLLHSSTDLTTLNAGT